MHLARVCLLAAFVLCAADASTAENQVDPESSAPWFGLNEVEQNPAVEAQTKSNSETIREILEENADKTIGQNAKQRYALRVILGFISALPRAKHFELCLELAADFSLPEPTFQWYLQHSSVASIREPIDFAQFAGMDAGTFVQTHICRDYYGKFADTLKSVAADFDENEEGSQKVDNSNFWAPMEAEMGVSWNPPSASGRWRNQEPDKSGVGRVVEPRLQFSQRGLKRNPTVDESSGEPLARSLRLSQNSGIGWMTGASFNSPRRRSGASLAANWQPRGVGNGDGNVALANLLQFHLTNMRLAEMSTTHVSVHKSTIGCSMDTRSVTQGLANNPLDANPKPFPKPSESKEPKKAKNKEPSLCCFC